MINTIACVQINSGGNMAENIARASELVRAAAEAGANLIAMPESVSLMAAEAREKLAQSYLEKDHPALSAFRAMAAELGVWLLIGSLAVKAEDKPGKFYNRSYLLGADGKIAARYDKIHLFDVTLPDGERHQESKLHAPGGKAIVADTPCGKLGMTVCYDLRFPHLFRALAKKGAEIIAVPAAFTQLTGKAHWHVLLRARAIETGCYIIAPAQTGKHPGGRETYGHALIVDPWGKVLAGAGTEEGIITAAIDTARVQEVRAIIPALTHDREFT